MQAAAVSDLEVPLLDLKAQYAGIAEEVMSALREVCDSQRFILGPNVERLEQKVAEYCGCRFGIGVSSGTDALLAALMAIDVRPGDEVITSPYSFFATAGVIARIGARPVFCDIEPRTFNLSPQHVKEFLSQACVVRGGRVVHRTTGGVVRAIMPVHLFGQMADMDALRELASAYELRLIEDAAQAIGAALPDSRRAGSVADIGCFSFFPSKNLGAFGDAGMCTTNDEVFAERLRILRSHGGKPKYHHAVVGGNFRLDELQAAVLLVKLKYLDEWTRARQQNAMRYAAHLRVPELHQFVSTPQQLSGYRHIYNQYVLRVERRDELRKHLSAHRIGTEIYYPIPLHMQKCFAYLGYAPVDCPESLRAAAETVAIPIYPELTHDQVDHATGAIARFYMA